MQFKAMIKENGLQTKTVNGITAILHDNTPLIAVATIKAVHNLPLLGVTPSALLNVVPRAEIRRVSLKNPRNDQPLVITCVTPKGYEVIQSELLKCYCAKFINSQITIQ